MTKPTETGFIGDWLKNNFLTLVILVGGMVLAWGALNARVEAMEAKIAEFPSADYFELKFQNIEERFDDIEEAVEGKADRTGAVRIQSTPSAVVLQSTPAPSSQIVNVTSQTPNTPEPVPQPTPQPTPLQIILDILPIL